MPLEPLPDRIPQVDILRWGMEGAAVLLATHDGLRITSGRRRLTTLAPTCGYVDGSWCSIAEMNPRMAEGFVAERPRLFRFSAFVCRARC